MFHIITRQPTSRYSSCCKAGKCSNSSSLSKSLVLLYPCFKTNKHEDFFITNIVYNKKATRNKNADNNNNNNNININNSKYTINHLETFL